MEKPDERQAKRPRFGEYVVRHERPYPERLERAFRIGAIAFAIAASPGFSLWLFAASNTEPTFGRILLACATIGLIPAALAYAAVWAAGALLIGVVVAFRRKQYVVDWEEHPPER